jgi:hypothetical protein
VGLDFALGETVATLFEVGGWNRRM